MVGKKRVPAGAYGKKVTRKTPDVTEVLITDAVTAELDRRAQAEAERIKAIRMPLMVMPPQKDLKDELAMAALIGMLSCGTLHKPEQVMRLVYEFAEAGMSARQGLEKSGILPCQMPAGHGNEEERERCAQEVEKHLIKRNGIVALEPGDECFDRNTSLMAAACCIRGLK